MHHISPGKYKTIWLVSMCSIISKHTYFLLKVYLHCNLPHFRNVSNTSAWRRVAAVQARLTDSILGSQLAAWLVLWYFVKWKWTENPLHLLQSYTLQNLKEKDDIIHNVPKNECKQIQYVKHTGDLPNLGNMIHLIYLAGEARGCSTNTFMIQ